MSKKSTTFAPAFEKSILNLFQIRSTGFSRSTWSLCSVPKAHIPTRNLFRVGEEERREINSAGRCSVSEPATTIWWS